MKQQEQEKQQPAIATITPVSNTNQPQTNQPQPISDVREITPMRLDLPENRERLNRIYTYITTTIHERRLAEEAAQAEEERSA